MGEVPNSDQDGALRPCWGTLGECPGKSSVDTQAPLLGCC